MRVREALAALGEGMSRDLEMTIPQVESGELRRALEVVNQSLLYRAVFFAILLCFLALSGFGIGYAVVSIFA
jgi:multidrug efflux pump subunit AcrB